MGAAPIWHKYPGLIVSMATRGHAICSTSQNDIIKRYMKYEHGTHVSHCCRPGAIDTPIFVRDGGDMSHDPTKIQDVSALQLRHCNDAIWMIVQLIISPAKVSHYCDSIFLLKRPAWAVIVMEFSAPSASYTVNVFKFSSDLKYCLHRTLSLQQIPMHQGLKI